jgi:hypothetical protein
VLFINKKIGSQPSHLMLMLEELLNPEVKKNGVKQVAIPADKRVHGHQVQTF